MVFIASLASGCAGAGIEPESMEEQDALLQADSTDLCLSAAPGVSPTSDWLGTYRAMVPDIVERYFPELSSTSIRVLEGNSSSSFLRTSYGIGAFARGPGKRNYSVVISRAFRDHHPDDAATYALMVHELQHIYDYEALSGAGLLALTVRLGTQPNTFVPMYERATDLRALHRMEIGGNTDAAEQMSDYRRWQYENLNPADVEKKKRNYLSPEEFERCRGGASAEGIVDPSCLISVDESRG